LTNLSGVRQNRRMTQPESLKSAIDAVTEEAVRKALKASRGSIRVAASSLGVSERTVRRMMGRYGIIIERVVA
jgi:transcriptional regulator with GAF, ATPase, and Fis domain